MRLAPVIVLLAAAASGEMVSRRQTVRPGAVLTAPMAFRAAGHIPRDGQPRRLRMRASPDGVAWSEWFETESGGLVFFGELCRYLELEADPAAPRLDLLWIDPGATLAKTRERIRRYAGVLPPPVVPRAEWGCTPEACPVRSAPTYTTVTHLVVHHTAGANSAADWPAVVRSIWVLHVQGNGWNDIGYNYLIDPEGVLYEGRAGGDGVLGAHYSGVNSGTMGVSLLGTYSTVAPADPAFATLRAMLGWQGDKWKLDAGGQGLHAASQLWLNTISGHRDAGLSPRATSTTECPGNGLYTLLPRLRAEVRSLQAGDCPVRLSETSSCVSPEGGTVEIRVTAPAGCAWSALSNADWIRIEEGARLRISANDGPRRTGRVTIAGQTVVIVQAAPGAWPVPCVAAVVTAAGADDRPVVPGSLISLYGTNLAGADSLSINGLAGTILWVGSSQINARLPTGIATGTARAVLTTGPEFYFWVTEAVPAIFTYGENRALAWNHEEAALNGPDSPVRAGGAVVVYFTGAGSSRLPAGASIAGRPAELLYLGPTPGFPGLYQANLIVPADLRAGDHPVVLTVSGASSRPALISVR